MAGEAILAFVQDPMFSVQLREAAAKGQDTVSVVTSVAEFEQRIGQVHPKLTILDLGAVGADLETVIRTTKQQGSKAIAYGPHIMKDLFERARQLGCDAVYPNSRFKMSTEAILSEWINK